MSEGAGPRRTASPGPADPTHFFRRSNRWLATAATLANPALHAAARLRARRAASAPESWRRGLIVGHSHIGDLLYRSCSLAQLAAVLPGCRWSYLCAPGAAEVLAGNPAVAEILPLMRGDDPWTLEDGAFAALRARDFDVVLCTDTIRYYAGHALAAALGAPNRVGFAHKGLAGLLTHPVPIDVPSPFPAYFRTMVAHLGGVAADWPLLPRVHPSDADRAAARALRASLDLDAAWPVVACAVTTRQPHGNWPHEHLLASLRLARERAPFELVLCGGAADAQALAAAAAALPFRTHVMAGALSLRAFAAFLESCDALVTLDTGTRHLGNAVGVPVLFVRNLLHRRVEAGAYVPGEIELAPPAERLSDAAIVALAARTDPADAAGMLLDVLRGGRPEAVGSV